MRVTRAWVLATVLGCGSSGREEPRRDVPPSASRLPSSGASAGTADERGDAEAPAALDVPTSTRSLELTRTVAVRLDPGDDAKRIGTIAVDTRVGWTRTASAKGCQRPWVEIRPRGWVCSDYMKPSVKAPYGREVPMLDRGELVPGVYGKVTAPNSVTYTYEKPKVEKAKGPARAAPKTAGAKKSGPITSTREVEAAPAKPVERRLVESKPLVGSINVRQYEEISVGGRAYWRISPRDSEYVLKQAITPHRPSLWAGSRLGDETGITVPIAFVWPRVLGWQKVWVTRKPGGGGTVRQIDRRSSISILETASDKTGKPTAYRIGEGAWIAAADVRLFQPAAHPPLLTRGERWIDVDLDSQILVAFEGDLPVYATMVSSGSKEYPTETGVYRMWLKESESDMKGLNGEDPYSVATVPWTQFYSPERGLALHTAYWHDQFGTRRSRGCLNMAPRDARWLYFWSEPQVPPGWTMAAGVVEAPGSLVRVRTKEDPAPEVRGYAKKVVEARQQNAAAR